MSESGHLALVPPLVETGRSDEFARSGRALLVAQSPLDGSLVVSVTPNKSDGSTLKISEQPIYFAKQHAPPSAERRIFITDTLVIFLAFQHLIKNARERGVEQLQNEQTQGAIRKLGTDYANFIKECWVHASRPIPQPEEPLQFSSEHYRELHTCFTLFMTLYLPDNGLEDAPVGDDLMEWLNTHYIEPSTEEGDHLSSLDKPWEDETFWPYLTRVTLRGLTKASIFFLEGLSKHPSEDLQDLTQKLIPVLQGQPRLQNFTAERDFAFASRRWKDKVKALRIDLGRVPEDERQDDFENWWDRFSDIVGILEGRSEVIQRICEELGGDWKEVCAAWGVFVDTRLRRRDLPNIVEGVLKDMPSDPTNLEDMIHASLLGGHPIRALSHASKLDVWLSAHLADVMDALGLIDDSNDRDEISTRDRCLLSYAEYLRSDPALWQITIEYMYACEEVGKERGDQVLLRVPLRLRSQTVGSEGHPEGKIQEGDVVGVLQKVNKACYEHKRESVRRTVCRIAAQTLVQGKDYGLAISYCTSAEDWPGLGRIVNRVLDEYITSGSSKFAHYAAEIAPSLRALQSQPGSQGVFIHRLMFAVRYAQFHQLRLRGDVQEAASELIALLHEEIAPKSWWGVLLCDSVEFLQLSPSPVTFFDSMMKTLTGPSLLFSSSEAGELLRKIEEITIRSAQGSGEDYLSVLVSTLKGAREKDALGRLAVVRLALAQYFARFIVAGSGGRSGFDHSSF